MGDAESQTFRWAILGTGYVARKFAFGLRALNGRASVHTIASRKYENAKRISVDLGIPHASADYLSAVSMDTIDAVYIATPPSEHEYHAHLAIGMGKPVLIEKPFALDGSAARRIVEMAKKARIFCMEAMWTRFLPLVSEIKARIDKGEIGDIRFLHGSFCAANTPDLNISFFDAKRGGGALMHRGVYPLSLARFFLGPINAVHSNAQIGYTGVDEDCALMLKHDSGAISMLHASLRTGGDNSIKIAGTKGVIEIHAPIYRPSKATITPIRPSALGGKNGVTALKESGLAQGFNQYAAPLIKRLGSRNQSFSRFYRGNGYFYEAEAAMNAIESGALESSLMPLTESIEIMDVITNARAQWVMDKSL